MGCPGIKCLGIGQRRYNKKKGVAGAIENKEIYPYPCTGEETNWLECKGGGERERSPETSEEGKGESVTFAGGNVCYHGTKKRRCHQVRGKGKSGGTIAKKVRVPWGKKTKR